MHYTRIIPNAARPVSTLLCSIDVTDSPSALRNIPTGKWEIDGNQSITPVKVTPAINPPNAPRLIALFSTKLVELFFSHFLFIAKLIPVTSYNAIASLCISNSYSFRLAVHSFIFH